MCCSYSNLWIRNESEWPRLRFSTCLQLNLIPVALLKSEKRIKSSHQFLNKWNVPGKEWNRLKGHKEKGSEELLIQVLSDLFLSVCSSVTRWSLICSLSQPCGLKLLSCNSADEKIMGKCFTKTCSNWAANAPTRFYNWSKLCILTSCEILCDSGTVQLPGLYLLAVVAVSVLRKRHFFNIPVQLDV